MSLGSVLRGPFQSSFIGYWIDEKQAGNGYVPEGVALVIRYGFDTLGLHRMEAAIVPRNEKSRRVAEKLGLRDEGPPASSCRSAACGKTTCATRSPPKTGNSAKTTSSAPS